MTNTLALVLFATSVAYMLQFMLAHGRDHALMYFVAQPDVLLASCTALVTLCYMTAFFGVAWVYEDLSAGPSPIRLVPATTHATDVGFDTDVSASSPQHQRQASPFGQALSHTPSSRQHTLRFRPLSTPPHRLQVVVVGAGTAGTALALRLAKDGRKVTVVERSWTIPHRIVGELMQPGGIRALEDMGLDEAAKTSAIDPIQVDGYVCFTPGADRSRDLVLPYPTHDPASIAEFAGLQGLPVGEPSRGPVSSGFDPRPGTPAQHPRGRSFHNHRFVQALRDMAKQHPNITMHEGRVTALLSPQDVPASHPAAKLGGGNAETAVGVKWVDAEKNSHTVTAPLTVVADGAHSALRKRVLTEPKVTASSFFVGLALHHEEGSCPLPYPRHGHVVLANPNPVLLYQISSTETRILVDVPAPLPDPVDGSLSKYLLTTVKPQLPEGVRDLFEEAVKTQNAEVCRNKHMSATPFTRNHAVALGDSFNMRHPLTGGGMTVALKDVASLWQHLQGVDLTDSRCVGVALAAHAASRGHHAATINVLANALHGVFTNPAAAGGKADPDSTRARLRDACMQYMSLGGAQAAGPVGLLAGLTPKPWVLVAHFFAVAAYAMRLALLPCPTPSSLRRAYDLLHVACIIIMPLLASERSTILSWLPVQFAVQAVFPWMGVTA